MRGLRWHLGETGLDGRGAGGGRGKTSVWRVGKVVVGEGGGL